MKGSKYFSHTGIFAPNRPSFILHPGDHAENFNGCSLPAITGTPTLPTASASTSAGSGLISVLMGIYPARSTPRWSERNDDNVSAARSASASCAALRLAKATLRANFFSSCKSITITSMHAEF